MSESYKSNRKLFCCSLLLLYDSDIITTLSLSLNRLQEQSVFLFFCLFFFFVVFFFLSLSAECSQFFKNLMNPLNKNDALIFALRLCQ